MKSINLTYLLLALPLSVSAQWQAPQLPGHRQALPQLRLAEMQTQDARRARGNGQPALVWAQPSQAPLATTAIPQADTQRFFGRKLYGALVNTDEWAGYSITEVPYGIYSFDMAETPEFKSHFAGMEYNFMAGAWGRQRHFGIVPMAFMGVINGAHNITIDTQRWCELRNTVFDSSYGTYSLIASVLTYDPTDDTFYGFQYKEDLSGLNWVKINPQTDQMEMIAAYRGHTAVMTLAAGPDGQMYYIDADGDLYTLNKKNGRTSLVGNTGVLPTAYNQCMMYDSRTGLLLWAAECTEGSVLFSVDPQSAETARVIRFRHNEQFVSLYQTDTEAPDAAPAAVTRPQLKYAADGSLDGNISFTVPSRTYGNATLQGEVNLNVWLDGENLKGVNVTPGDRIDIPVSLTEGNHYVAITLDNEAGFSPLRQIYQYAGYDTPEAVSNVVFEQQDGQNSITWKAPTLGVNRGYLDFDNLSYDIVRMPDSVTVATGVTALSYSEPTPSDMHSYCYRIIADNHGHKSDFTQSNRILCGDSFTVPYEQQFADATTLSDYFVVVDNDGDGNTWRQGYTTEVRLDYFHKADADDWLISPSIRLDADMMYRFTMNMKIFTQAYPEDFEILVGTDPTDLTSFRLVKREEMFTRIASEFADYQVNFLNQEAGNYHLAVRYCSTMDSKGDLMMIHNFRLDAVGKAQSPAQVSDFVVTPDADDALKATLTFVAPSVNLRGESLTSISSIRIMRNGVADPVYTIQSPQPGQTLSWTDETVPYVGLHTYTIVADNEFGAGEPLTVEQFVGIYQPPYYQDFEDRRYADLWTVESIGAEDPNGWYGWKWTDNENTLGRHFNIFYYSMVDGPVTHWLYSPLFRLDADAVYTIQYDASMSSTNWATVSYDIFMGKEASSEGMTTHVCEMPSTGYAVETVERLLVNTEAGKYHLGFNASCTKQYDYVNASIDNFHLLYRTSAFAPFEMTNYQSVADATAALRATLSFDAPAVNYHRQALDANEPLTITIYHGKNATLPAYTATVKPGEHVTWVDEEALHGFNYYTITCQNHHGQGEVISDTLFVGRDVPELVNDYYLRGSKDNRDAVLSWSAPVVGQNGGIVLADELTYSVYAYDRTTNVLTLLAEGLTEPNYTIKHDEADQQLFYYAVSATMPTEGEGRALVSSVVLGRLYELPFAESFANTTTTTQLWQSVPLIEGACQCGFDNPNGDYNGCDGAQDGDGGCVYIYNGSQSEAYAGSILVTPKLKLMGGAGNELHFWAYHFPRNTEYQQQAYVQIITSIEDHPYEVLEGAQYSLGVNTGMFGNKPGWREHVVKLDDFMHADYIALGLMGITGGYLDVIYLDNISVVNTNAEGISAVHAEAPAISHINYYDAAGREVIAPRSGSVCVRTITYTDGSQRSEIVAPVAR